MRMFFGPLRGSTGLVRPRAYCAGWVAAPRGIIAGVDSSNGLLPLGIAKVSGASMVPALYDGDTVLVRYGARIRPGDLVLALDPRLQDGPSDPGRAPGQGLILVKRATRRQDDGWWLLADNPFAPGDSRQFGAVPERLVLGRVLFRFRPLFRSEAAAQRPTARGCPVRRALRRLWTALRAVLQSVRQSLRR
jgi:nickel-type superoxide dismutase maturation protease